MLGLFRRPQLFNCFVAPHISMQYNLVSKETACKFLWRNNLTLWKKYIYSRWWRWVISHLVSHHLYRSKILVKLGDSVPSLCRINCTSRKYAMYNMQKRAKKLYILSELCQLIHGRTVESDFTLNFSWLSMWAAPSSNPLPGVRFLP